MRHNLVNILYVIKGFAESHTYCFHEGRFRNEVDALSHAHSILKQIYEQTEAAIDITRKIGVIMKTAPRVSGEIKPVSIKNVWNEVVSSIQMQLPAYASVDFIEHIADEFPQVLCEKEDLFEILHLLCENAIQAMKKKGKIIIRTGLGLPANNESLAYLSIADTGPGISEQALNCLFEPFATTKNSEKGNGLGLCIAKGLVRRNNGNISVSSFKGCGTTFTISFPIAKSSCLFQ